MRPNDQSLTQRISPAADGNRWMQLTGSTGMNGSSLIIKDITFQYLGSYRLVNAAGGVLNVTVDQPFELTLENIVFDNCVGLAIVNSPRGNPVLNFENCLFKECVATNRRDNTNIMRGLISKEGGSLAIRNTTFYSNENQDSHATPSLSGYNINAATNATYPAMNLVLEKNSFINNLNTIAGYTALSPVIALKPDGPGAFYLSAFNNIMIGNRRIGEMNDVDMFIANRDKLLLSESSGNLLNRSVRQVSAGVYEDYSLEGSSVNEEYTYTHAGINFLMDGNLPLLIPDFYGIGKLSYGPLTAEKESGNISLRVFTVNRTLRIEGLTPGNRIDIYNLNGYLITRSTADSDHFETKLSMGVYLVKTANISHKVIVF